jgi:hypothetical protein
VLKELLASPAPIIQESAARLINVLASSSVGRTYLLYDNTLIPVCVGLPGHLLPVSARA